MTIIRSGQHANHTHSRPSAIGPGTVRVCPASAMDFSLTRFRFRTVLIAFFTQPITANIGFRYGYIFAASNIAGAVFVWFFLYESSGLSLEAVDAMYRDKNVKPWTSKNYVPEGYSSRYQRDDTSDDQLTSKPAFCATKEFTDTVLQWLALPTSRTRTDCCKKNTQKHHNIPRTLKHDKPFHRDIPSSNRILGSRSNHV